MVTNSYIDEVAVIKVIKDGKGAMQEFIKSKNYQLVEIIDVKIFSYV